MDDKLVSLKGGTTNISSGMINSFTNIIKVIFEVGKSLGSSIRRIAEGNLCSLD